MTRQLKAGVKKRSHKRKEFPHGALVRVKEPGRRAFVGKVYSEYQSPGRGRLICVYDPHGCGVAYPMRWVTVLGGGT